MKRLVFGLAVILGVCGSSGCRPSEEELGKIHYKMPRVPGTERPYRLPFDDPSQDAATNKAPQQPADSNPAADE